MIGYEWDIEETEAESGDILDHYHVGKLSEFSPEQVAAIDNRSRVLVLVRDDWGMDGERSWAYTITGPDGTLMLPTHFEDAYNRDTAKVPKKFHAELARAAITIKETTT